MTAELTSEEIVTKLLTSNEIINSDTGNFYISNPTIDTLGDYLSEIPPAIIPLEIKPIDSFKYRFIKQ